MGEDDLVVAHRAQLAAQRLDVGVDGALQAFAVVLPDRRHDLRPAQDASRAFEQQRQQQVFVAGQRQPVAVVGDAQAITVDGEFRRFFRLTARFAVGVQAAQDGAHPRSHFARAERFGDVIVAAQFKADDAVDLVGTRGEKEHRQVGVAAQRAADVKAGDVGQADVEHDEIDAALLQPRQRLAAQRAALGGEALGAQRVAQRIGDGRFVVDDQDVHDGGQ